MPQCLFLAWRRIKFIAVCFGLYHESNTGNNIDICKQSINNCLVKLSVEELIQYNNLAHSVSSNVRFRYNPREGNDFFVVVNQGTNTDLFRFEPTLPRLNDRTIILKYTYTFVR